MRYLITIAALWLPVAVQAQNVFNGKTTFTDVVTFQRPAVQAQGTVLPSTCPALGAIFFKTNNTAGQNLYAVTSLSPCTWTQQAGGGGGGAGDPAGYTTVTFSSTPVFAITVNTVAFLKLTLTGDVVSSTLTVASGNPRVILKICQDSTGNRAFVFPTNVLNMTAVTTVASTCTTGFGTWDGTNVIVESSNTSNANGSPLSGSVDLPGSTSGLTTLGVPNVAGTDHRFNFPTGNGSNGNAMITDGGTPTAQLSWGSAGGGSAITSGTYASLPGTCATSDLYLLTSGVFPFSRCTGTDVWSFFYYGHIITPAAQLSLATLGGSAPAPDSLVSTNGYEVMTRSSGGGSAYSYRYWSAPGSTPYTKYVVTLPQTNLYVNPGYKQFAVGFMDASGKSFVLSCGQGTAVVGGYFCRGLNVNADGSVNAEISTAVNTVAGIGGRELIFVLRDDATNINIGFSNGGPDYYYATEARTSFLSSPSRFTYGMEVTTTDAAAVTMVGVY